MLSLGSSISNDGCGRRAAVADGCRCRVRDGSEWGLPICEKAAGGGGAGG